MVTRDAPAFRALYPFASRSFDRDGLSYHYLDEGPKDGVPVVMVHGNPTWSFYYRRLVLALRGERRCLVPDHIGMGFSDKPGDDRYTYTLASRVADLGAWLDSLGLDSVDVVAHDWGGMIASAWMVEHPERVRRIVLMNTAAFPNPRGRRIPPTLKLARDSSLGALLVRGFNAFSVGATRLAVERALPADVRAGYTLPYDSWANRIATLRFVQDIPLVPGDPAWSVVEATEAKLGTLADKPLFLPWGLRDFVFDEAFLERFREHFPKAEVARYPDAGHYLLEDAGDAVTERIAEFLQA
ncbi:MAG: alpha/beta fold hydrolase [Deltaproteobacteria bacterium]|nr:alpha/beta fold hydrolase [Deltaproteobacteria bacterium]